jgi:hypothetical protein
MKSSVTAPTPISIAASRAASTAGDSPVLKAALRRITLIRLAASAGMPACNAASAAIKYVSASRKIGIGLPDEPFGLTRCVSTNFFNDGYTRI